MSTSLLNSSSNSTNANTPSGGGGNSGNSLITSFGISLPPVNASSPLFANGVQQQQQQQHQHQQQQLQQLMATQTIFNSLTPEQRLIAQQLAAETIQMSLLQQQHQQQQQDIPKNIKVKKN